MIVVVSDGVSFGLAQATWEPSHLLALTSTFPSTTSTALLSATTGLSPSTHGVIGVAFYDEAANGIFNCYDDRTAPTDFVLGPWPTVFSHLAAKIDCVAHIGSLSTIPGRWSSAVAHGARIVQPKLDWRDIENDPAMMVATSVGLIDATLRQPRTRPMLIWAHVNVDAAIHLRGYDKEVREAVAELGHTAARWARSGHTVIVHSDHGLVEIRESDRARRLLALLNDPRLCRARSGGAGRVIWAYPLPGSDLLARASRIAKEFATILHRDDLIACGAVDDTAIVRERLGEVVAIATTAEFPKIVPQNHFEHGGFSEDEMIVPAAIWRE